MVAPSFKPGDGHQIVAAAAAAGCRSIESQWQEHIGAARTSDFERHHAGRTGDADDLRRHAVDRDR